MDINWNEVPEVGGIPYWKLSEIQVGDWIAGLLVNIEENVGKFNSTVALIETRDQGRMYVPLNAVLLTKIGSIPTGGTHEIRIEYLGKEKGKTGQQYNNFKVQAVAVGGEVVPAKKAETPATDIDLDNIPF